MENRLMSTINLDLLSPPQRQVYDLLAQGKTVDAIVKKLDTTLGVVNAQITRIRNKGIPLPGEGTTTPLVDPEQPGFPGFPALSQPTVSPARDPAAVDPAKIYAAPQSPPPAATGASSNAQVINALEGTGQAVLSDKVIQKIADKVGPTLAKDLHPLAVLGVTMQYVRFCGGRMTAHQIIEDVYAALQLFTGKPAKGDSGKTEPMPQTDRDQLEFLREQNEQLRKRITDLEARQKQTSGGYGYRS
jgi:DNA-binding CsgD family transcriptional regulator